MLADARRVAYDGRAAVPLVLEVRMRTMSEPTLALLVIELQVTDPGDIPEALKAINPPSVPHFGGGVHVAMDAFGEGADNPATAIVNYLKGEGE